MLTLQPSIQLTGSGKNSLRSTASQDTGLDWQWQWLSQEYCQTVYTVWLAVAVNFSEILQERILPVTSSGSKVFISIASHDRLGLAVTIILPGYSIAMAVAVTVSAILPEIILYVTGSGSEVFQNTANQCTGWDWQCSNLLRISAKQNTGLDWQWQ